MSDSGSSSSSSSSLAVAILSSPSSPTTTTTTAGFTTPGNSITPINTDFSGQTKADPSTKNLTTYTNELRTKLFSAADLFGDNKLGGDYTVRGEFIKEFYDRQNSFLGGGGGGGSSPYGSYLNFRPLVKDHNQHWNVLWNHIKRSKAEPANADSTSNQMELLNGPYNPRSRWDVACSGHTVLPPMRRGSGIRQRLATKKAYCNCGDRLEITQKRKYNSKSGFAAPENLSHPAFAINSPQAAADIKNSVSSRSHNDPFKNYQLDLTQDDRDLNFFNNLKASVNATTRSVLREQVGDRNTDGNHNYNTNKDVLRSLGNRAEGGFCWYSERLRSGGEIGGGSGGSSGETKSSGGTGGSDPEKRLLNEKILRGDQAFLWEKNDHKNWMENYCWLCSHPLWINADCTGSPQSEHKMACYLMALTANGLSKTKKKQGKTEAYASQDRVGRRGSEELDQSKDNIHLFKHKILIRAEGMAWSHPWCNNHKSQTQFISLRKKRNVDGTYTFLYVIEFHAIRTWSLDLFEKSRFRSRIGYLKSIGNFDGAEEVLKNNTLLWHTNNAPLSKANINKELGKHPMSAYHMAKDSPGIDSDLSAMESNANFFWSEPNRQRAEQNIITRLIPLVCLLNQASDIEPEAFRYYSNLLGSLGTGDGQQYWRSWSTKLAPHEMTEKGEQTSESHSAKIPEPKNQTSIANRIRQNCKRWNDYAPHHTPNFVKQAANATQSQLGAAVNNVLDCINPPQGDSSCGGGGIWLNNIAAIRGLVDVDDSVLTQAQLHRPSDTSMEYTSSLDGIEEGEEEEEGSEGGGTKKKRRRKRRTRRKRKYHKKTRKRITKKRRKKTKRRRKRRKKTRRRR